MRYGIGGQIIIEPGMTEKQIDKLFQNLSNASFRYARIRMFELYMKDANGDWDFTLFDFAFKAAEKYNIDVFATLFPATRFEDIGGFKFPFTDEHFEDVKIYIKNVVPHFSKYSSCYGWVLINEPGQNNMPSEEFSEKRYQEYLLENPNLPIKENGCPGMDFSREHFMLDYTSRYLHELADLVKEEAPDAHLHVNPHAIFSSVLGTYNLPQWSEFLTSLGGSAHPSWHFGDFDRADYTIAMSANSEILRSGAGKLPWFMTEIQGGNNIYTGGSPLCPTADEIVQWLMTVLFHEGKGGIFWSFNQRSAGIEAAEWGMLDLKGEPTDRVHAASKVAQFIEDNLQILEVAKVDDSNVHLIYNRESLWVESRVVPIKQNMLGRSGRSGIISTQTYYKTLSEIGIAATISEINEFDFSKTSYAGELMIFPNQIALTDEQLELIKSFAEKGGTVLLSGLTGFFDQNAFCRHMATNMLDELVGAELKEVKYLSDSFTLNMEKYQLNSQMVYSILNPISAEPWAYYGKEITGTRNKVGDGEVLWISSPIALEAKVNSNTSLKTLLKDILSQIKVKVPENSGVGLFTKTLVSKELNLTLYINKSNSPQKVKVDSKSEIIFSSCTNEIINDSIKIKPEETVVVKTYLL